MHTSISQPRPSPPFACQTPVQARLNAKCNMRYLGASSANCSITHTGLYGERNTAAVWRWTWSHWRCRYVPILNPASPALLTL